MRLKFHLTSLLLFALSSPAFADITANYVDDNGMTVKFEVASNDDIRWSGSIGGISADSRRYFIVHEGQGYEVRIDANRPTVIRMDDIAAIMADFLKKRLPKSPANPSQLTALYELEKGGLFEVRGRKGIAYYLTNDRSLSPTKPRKPMLVVSNAPDLQPLSSGITAYFSFSMAMMGHLFDYVSKSERDALITGVPLKLSNLELDTVTRDPIPATRFVLPAQPLSLEAARKYMGTGGE